MGFIIVHTLSKTFTKVITFSEVLAVGGRPDDFHFNADPIALKLVTLNKIVFRVGMGSCLARLKCKRNACYVAVTDSFVLINVSTKRARCSSIQFMAAKETKSKGTIKKQSKMALYVLFENKNASLFLYFICLLFNLRMSQIILPDPAHAFH